METREKNALIFADERGAFAIDLDRERCYEWIESRNKWIQTKRVSAETKQRVIASHRSREESGLSDRVIVSIG